MSRKNDGINETILGWFKRVHPKELWTVKEMPPTVTFKGKKKSMVTGLGMGEAEHHSDTATREPMLDRLAELLDKDIDELIDWCNANSRERVRREYKAKHPKAKKPDIKKLRDLALAAEVAVRDLASALSAVDRLALGDGLGKDGTAEFRSTFRVATSRLSDAADVLGEAGYLL